MGPAAVESCLEAVYRWGVDHVFRQCVPDFYVSIPEGVLPDAGSAVGWVNGLVVEPC